MKDHKPLWVRVVGPEVGISTFQRQLENIASSSIPGSALVVLEVKAMVSMPRGDDSGVFMVQDLWDNFNFVLGYITYFSDHPRYSDSHPFKILNQLEFLLPTSQILKNNTFISVLLKLLSSDVFETK